MNKAIEYARDILKLKSIANSTKSQKLKSDYTKSCKRKEKELMLYPILGRIPPLLSEAKVGDECRLFFTETIDNQ